MTKERRDELVVLFKTEVHDRGEEIDGSSEQDWYSLTLGWAVAKGLLPTEAHEFARHVRYHTELG